MNTCKNFVDSIKNADFTGIFRLIMKEPSYVEKCASIFISLINSISYRLGIFSYSPQSYHPICGDNIHTGYTHYFTEDDTERVLELIKSFRGRKSDYSRNKSSRLYLSEKLNI